MENKASKKIKWLMVVILLLFLIPSGIDLVSGFGEGWHARDREGELIGLEDGHHQSFFVKIKPTSTESVFKPVGENLQFLTFEETGQLVITKQISEVWWVMVLRALLSMTVLVTLIVFIVRLFRFAAKISKRRIMAEENIGSLRKIAYTLGILSLSGYLIEVTEILWARSYVSLEGYKIVMALPPASLIVALIILVMTEVLKLGNKLQQEQDLTI